MTQQHPISDDPLCASPLQMQCETLNVHLTHVEGRKSKDAPGKWDGRKGPVRIEEFALDYYRGQGYDGFAFEGKGYSAWLNAQNICYRRLFKRIPGFDFVDGRHISQVPGPERAADYLTALRLARSDIDALYCKHRAWFDKLWKPVTLSILTRFSDLIGWDMLERLHFLDFGLGASVVRGWPDLILRRGEELRFVEVKSTDRLRGSQVEWIRDVARPLGLNVSVTRVVEA